ncbi:unnamed protein product [Calicophoron daubneyi]|uniref:ETS domain-containing protein n=1 Tax=Calicophoron daubneyi TaxID=300641 RepID=A0AAV2T6X1_CALDB
MGSPRIVSGEPPEEFAIQDEVLINAQCPSLSSAACVPHQGVTNSLGGIPKKRKYLSSLMSNSTIATSCDVMEKRKYNPHLRDQSNVVITKEVTISEALKKTENAPETTNIDIDHMESLNNDKAELDATETAEVDDVMGAVADAGANNGKLTLWQFLLELLLSNKYRNLIRWTDKKGEFILLQAEGVAKLWGMRKDRNHRMNYDKLSRALRYYYEKNIIRKVHGHKFVYQFMGLRNLIKLCQNTNSCDVEQQQYGGDELVSCPTTMTRKDETFDGVTPTVNSVGLPLRQNGWNNEERKRGIQDNSGTGFSSVEPASKVGWISHSNSECNASSVKEQCDIDLDPSFLELLQPRTYCQDGTSQYSSSHAQQNDISSTVSLSHNQTCDKNVPLESTEYLVQLSNLFSSFISAASQGNALPSFPYQHSPAVSAGLLPVCGVNLTRAAPFSDSPLASGLLSRSGNNHMCQLSMSLPQTDKDSVPQPGLGSQAGNTGAYVPISTQQHPVHSHSAFRPGNASILNKLLINTDGAVIPPGSVSSGMSSSSTPHLFVSPDGYTPTCLPHSNHQLRPPSPGCQCRCHYLHHTTPKPNAVPTSQADKSPNCHLTGMNKPQFSVPSVCVPTSSCPSALIDERETSPTSLHHHRHAVNMQRLGEQISLVNRVHLHGPVDARTQIPISSPSTSSTAYIHTSPSSSVSSSSSSSIPSMIDHSRNLDWFASLQTDHRAEPVVRNSALKQNPTPPNKVDQCVWMPVPVTMITSWLNLLTSLGPVRGRSVQAEMESSLIKTAQNNQETDSSVSTFSNCPIASHTDLKWESQGN